MLMFFIVLLVVGLLLKWNEVLERKDVKTTVVVLPRVEPVVEERAGRARHGEYQWHN